MRLPTGKEYYYLPRELYSVAALTDDTGTIVEAATYDTYGKVAVYDGSVQPVDESPVGNPYYFTGRRLDLLPTVHSPQPVAKQLYHYRNRAYDPGNGRFTQRDPLTYADSMNLQEYVCGLPTVQTDPEGSQVTPGPQSITLLDEVLQGVRIEIHFETGGMHAHIARNSATEAYFVWRDGQFVRTVGATHNNTIRSWLGNQHSRSRIRSAIAKGRRLRGGVATPGALLNFVGWGIIVAEATYVIEGSLELRDLSEDNFHRQYHEMNRNTAIENGVRVGRKLGRRVSDVLTFTCGHCDPWTRRQVTPKKCIERFVNAVGNIVGFNAGLAFDQAAGIDEDKQYNVSAGIDAEIVILYRCAEDECFKTMKR